MKNEEKKEETFKVHLEVPRRAAWSALALIVTMVFTYLQFVGYLIPEFNKMSVEIQIDTVA